MKTNSITITLVANDHPESRQAGEKTVTKVRGRQSQGKNKRTDEWNPSIWLDCEAWQGTWAQKDLATLRKGDTFTVTGRLTVREWESDNGKREFWGIRVESADVPRRDDGQQYTGGSATKHHERDSRGHSTAPRDEVPFEDDEDIPF